MCAPIWPGLSSISRAWGSARVGDGCTTFLCLGRSIGCEYCMHGFMGLAGLALALVLAGTRAQAGWLAVLVEPLVLLGQEVGKSEHLRAVLWWDLRLGVVHLSRALLRGRASRRLGWFGWWVRGGSRMIARHFLFSFLFYIANCKENSQN